MVEEHKETPPPGTLIDFSQQVNRFSLDNWVLLSFYNSRIPANVSIPESALERGTSLEAIFWEDSNKRNTRAHTLKTALGIKTTRQSFETFDLNQNPLWKGDIKSRSRPYMDGTRPLTITLTRQQRHLGNLLKVVISVAPNGTGIYSTQVWVDPTFLEKEMEKSAVESIRSTSELDTDLPTRTSSTEDLSPLQTPPAVRQGRKRRKVQGVLNRAKMQRLAKKTPEQLRAARKQHLAPTGLQPARELSMEASPSTSDSESEQLLGDEIYF